jgi:hypothetical protein
MGAHMNPFKVPLFVRNILYRALERHLYLDLNLIIIQVNIINIKVVKIHRIVLPMHFIKRPFLKAVQKTRVMLPFINQE